MNVFAVLAVIAAFGAVIALVSGIHAMAHGGVLEQQRSAEWMNWRVVFQAIAFVCSVLALVLSYK